MTYDKLRKLSWSDLFWLFINLLVLGAFLSSAIWCVVWFVGFLILSLINGSFGISTNTTAFIVTVTVLLGHLPKFVAMLFGTDTDFQDFRSIISKFSLRNLAWGRLIFSAFLIWYLVAIELPVAYNNLNVPFDSLKLLELWGATWQNIKICVILFLIQTVFSFPTDVLIPSGNKLPGASG